MTAMAIAAMTPAGPENGDEGYGEQHRREDQNHVEAAGYGGVDPAAEIAGGQPERSGDRQRGRHCRHGDQQAHPQAVDHAAQHVPTEHVRAEGVHKVRRAQHSSHLDRRRIVRRDPRAERGDGGESGEESGAGDSGNGSRSSRGRAPPARWRHGRSLTSQPRRQLAGRANPRSGR